MSLNLHPERGLLWYKDKEQKEYLEKSSFMPHQYLFPQCDLSLESSHLHACNPHLLPESLSPSFHMPSAVMLLSLQIEVSSSYPECSIQSYLIFSSGLPDFSILNQLLLGDKQSN